jgi:hypothetical protein
MNWDDPQTDVPAAGKTALNDADRAKAYGLAQQRVTEGISGYR